MDRSPVAVILEAASQALDKLKYQEKDLTAGRNGHTAHSNELPKPWHGTAAVNHLPMTSCTKPDVGPALFHRSDQLAHT